jgi:hypothetical protein
MNRF